MPHHNERTETPVSPASSPAGRGRILLLIVLLSGLAQSAERQPWTSGTVTGTPEPPPACRTAVRYPGIRFQQPLLIRSEPVQQRIWVCQRDGKVFSFRDRADATAADLFVDLPAAFASLTPHASAQRVGAVYGLAFHPEFPNQPYCWITYTLVGGGSHFEDGTRLSRFRVRLDEDNVPRCDVQSERVLLTWLEGGHNGACLEFGPDGMLYVSTGDGEVPSPPDPRKAGQDVSNLLSTILRLEVSTAADGPMYAVPDDNPFVDLPGARPEIWAYGFRNPWKMSFAPDGTLWVGDVGWELYEMVYRVERGGNYGWSIMEGPQPVHPHGRRGPTPIIPAAVALPHADAASVTGGYVYRGQRFPELRGKYIFGDFETRRVWSSVPDGNRLESLTDLVEPTVRLVAFGEDTAGELLLLDFDAGTIHELVANEARPAAGQFPRRLSETGVFRDVQKLEPAAGVMPFAVNVPLWEDGATAVRHVAVPGTAPIIVHDRQIRRSIGMLREWMTFPGDSVLTRTVSLQDDSGRSIRLETQLLHFDQNHWKGYSYVWNPEQTDATLAPAPGRELTLADYGSFTNRETWTVDSRGACVRCHNPWSGGPLAFTIPQLNTAAADSAGNQLADFHESGLLTGFELEQLTARDSFRPLASPQDQNAGLAERARSYLSVNCAHCHQNGAGGTATIDLRHSIPRGQMQVVAAPAAQGSFSLTEPRIVVPGDPSRSILMYRMSCSGRGRMPHIGSTEVDADGVALIRAWIRSLDPDQPQQPSPPDTERPLVLANSSVALELVEQLEAGQLSSGQREAILTRARTAPAEIAGLFARFQPAEYRRSLQRSVDRAAVLQLEGHSERGRQVFFDKRTQCAVCHRVDGKGGQVGPVLSETLRKQSPAEILDSMLFPSRRIDPKFAAWTAVAADGRVLTGLLVRRDERTVQLRTADAKDVTLQREEIDELFPQTVSLMPDRLLTGMDVQQVADLLAFLKSLAE